MNRIVKMGTLIKYGLLLLFIVNFIYSGHSLISSSKSDEENISYMINLAGRERMMTEKMYRISIAHAHNPSKGKENELQDTIALFERNFYGLMYGSEELRLAKIENQELVEQFKTAEQNWLSLKGFHLSLLKEKDEGQQLLLLNEIHKRSNNQIELLDVIVGLIEETGKQTFKGVNSEKILLLFLNVFLFLTLFIAGGLFLKLKRNEEKYRKLIDCSPMGILTTNSENAITFINEQGFKTLGASSSDALIGKSIYDFFKSGSKSLNQDNYLNEEISHKVDGQQINIEMVSMPLHAVGERSKMVMFKDITAKVESMNKVESIYKELKNVQSALEVSSIVEIVDKSGKILHVNEKFSEVTQYQADEIIGHSHRLLSSGEHEQAFYEDLWTTILQGKVWEGQVKNKRKDGCYYWTQTIIVPYINSQGDPYQFIVIRNDITSKKEAEKEIQILATHDHLTYLSNRRFFESKLQEAVNRREKTAVFFIDLDRFKYINDSLGHTVGDNLLKAVANRLKRMVPHDAVVARQGGDEFTILFKEINQDALVLFAQQIIDVVKAPYIINQSEIFITCSIGISIYPEDSLDAETLLKNADVAMYWSKENGKNKFSFYQSHMKEKSARIQQLEVELRKAVDNQEFVLYYQPKLDLATKNIVGFEALVRWEHPTKGIIPPGEFIPLAEETGLINEMGEWILKEACLQNKKWHDKGYTEFVMAVNMSAHQFKQADMVEKVKAILIETKLQPCFLEIEITESISMLMEEVVLKQLHALKFLGVSIAIDDFGTGYNSLKYLEKLPIDVLKIDKCFIDKIQSHNKSSMTKAIITLAKSLNMKVVAEGIEDMEQLQYLKKLDCDYGQGYLISRPMPAFELEKNFLDIKDNKSFLLIKRIG